MLVGSLHTLADLGQVCEDSLLVTFTHALRRRDLVTLGCTSCVIGVLLGEKDKESGLEMYVSFGPRSIYVRLPAYQEEIVFYGGCVVVAPDTSAEFPVPHPMSAFQ